ncbi:winged helix-turn-helix transcriptional regulator [Salipaludibacillus sp. CF4.18]|uniref:winged helix-turn-helix transcriptional regulator n=1 Tax=Salipaludibacillus sp. CF4.18 TaxID=3373081 RepID=UPI003EE5A403
MEKKKELPLCPVETTVGLISNKWKILILRELLKGTKRFGELRNGIDGISQKVLTQNLRSMEEDGIIQRQAYPEVPPRVEYFLSDLGETLKPIIATMEQWGLGYQEMMNHNG